MKKIQILAAICWLLSVVVVLTAFGYLLRENQRQMICGSHLKHWHTAFQLYGEIKGWPLTTAQNHEAWLTTVRSYLYSPETEQCPASVPAQGCFSYKVNTEVLSLLAVTKFPNSDNRQTVWLFDGVPDQHAMANWVLPYQSAAGRHWQRANLLLLDGTVTYSPELPADGK